jgi:hypothetical protein
VSTAFAPDACGRSATRRGRVPARAGEPAGRLTRSWSPTRTAASEDGAPGPSCCPVCGGRLWSGRRQSQQWVGEHPVILFNTTAPTDRLRLTLAHELAHLVLHADALSVDDVEAQATAFAGEFLMPAEVIRPALRNLKIGPLLDLKREYGVSMQALIERAYHLDLLSPRRAGAPTNPAATTSPPNTPPWPQPSGRAYTPAGSPPARSPPSPGSPSPTATPCSRRWGSTHSEHRVAPRTLSTAYPSTAYPSTAYPSTAYPSTAE